MGEVRFVAAWPGMLKKRLNSDHRGATQPAFPGVFGAELMRGAGGVN